MSVTAPERARRGLVRLAWFPLHVIIVALALAVLGAMAPAIPVLGLTSFAAGYAAWFAVAAAAATGLVFWGFRRDPSRVRAVSAALGALTAIGAVVMAIRLVAVGAAYGVAVDPFAAHLPASEPDAVAVYGSHDGEELEVAIWQPADAPDGGAPVAFFVHGGGWIEGSPTDRSPHKRWFADRGWLVVSVEYTLSSPIRHLWDTAEAQVGCALIWTAQHAGEYGGDASRLAVLGDSAGGNLAVNASYRATAGTLDPSCDGEVPEVDAAAVVYPALDPVSFHDNPDLVLGDAARHMTESYTGGTPEEYPERYRAITSSTHIHPSAPATLVMVAENDHLVPPEGSLEFAADARRAGVDVELVRVPYTEHAFDASPLGAELYRGVTESWLRDQPGLAP